MKKMIESCEYKKLKNLYVMPKGSEFLINNSTDNILNLI